jgi:hypothetical protein
MELIEKMRLLILVFRGGRKCCSIQAQAKAAQAKAAVRKKM